jgi:hypothetical protein
VVVDALHAQISQLASCGRVDDRELRSGAGSGLLLLLAADAGGGLWWWLVLGLLLLRSPLACGGEGSEVHVVL